MQMEHVKKSLELAPRLSRPVEDSESEECVLPTGTAHEDNFRVE